MEKRVTINGHGVSFEGSENVWNGRVVNVRKTTELSILNGCMTRELHLSKAVLLKKEETCPAGHWAGLCPGFSPASPLDAGLHRMRRAPLRDGTRPCYSTLLLWCPGQWLA